MTSETLSAPSMRIVRHRNNSLDGLRGVSVLLVILYHHSYLNSGWMGVDFFFVLSGYLITTIIWRTRDDRLFWREFWIKRSTRILPPLVVALCLTALLCGDLSVAQTMAYFFSLGDVLAYLRPGFEPLRPLWSLAVEEHFYLVWPFAVRLLSARALVWLLVVVIVGEPIARSFAIMAIPSWQFVYFLTPFRLDGLALGCLLAVLFLRPGNTAFAEKYSGMGFLATVAVWFAFRIGFGQAFTRSSPSVVYSAFCYSLVSLAAFFALAHLLTRPQSIYARALSWKPISYLGTISYGVYLYHVVILIVVTRKLGLSTRAALAVDLPLVLIVSWFSFHYYESPIISWGKKRAEALHSREIQQGHLN